MENRLKNYDANSQTFLSEAASSAAAAATDTADTHKYVERFGKLLSAECGFELVGPEGYDVYFTSGASEANCYMLNGCARAFAAKTRVMPHIITSSADSYSTLECLRRLEKDRLCQITILPLEKAKKDYGVVDVHELKCAMRENTCLVSITIAGADLGVIKNIQALARVARAAGVPFHTDASQFIGRSSLYLSTHGIDAASLTFHKIHGPPGVGAIILRKTLVDGYGLMAPIASSCNASLLAAAEAAFKDSLDARRQKNMHMRSMKDLLKSILSEKLKTANICDNVSADHAADIYWAMPADESIVMPNTLTFAVARFKNDVSPLVHALKKRGLIVGATAAYAVRDNELIPCGNKMVRVSFGDDVEANGIKRLGRILAELI